MDAEILSAVFQQMRNAIKGDEFAAKVVPSKGVPSLEVMTGFKPNTDSKLVMAVDVVLDGESRPTGR